MSGSEVNTVKVKQCNMFYVTVYPVPELNLLLCPVPHPRPPCHCAEPTAVELYVDGVSDICTKGGDINFVFTGFSVNGKVWRLSRLLCGTDSVSSYL